MQKIRLPIIFLNYAQNHLKAALNLSSLSTAQQYDKLYLLKSYTKLTMKQILQTNKICVRKLAVPKCKQQLTKLFNSHHNNNVFTAYKIAL